MMISSEYKDKKTVLGFAVLFALGFQFLLTVSVGDNELRVGASDLLLVPALGAFLFFFRALPCLKIKYGYRLLALLSLWMLISFIVGIHYTGEVQKWVVVNKLIGWFVLLAYFLCGAWIAREGEVVLRLFLQCAFLLAFCIAIYSLAIYWQALYGLVKVSLDEHVRLHGFSANPNAYGIFLATLFVLLLPCMDRKFFFTQRLNYLLAAVILLALYYTLSRSAWLGFLLGTAGLLVLRPGVWKALALAVGAFLLLNVLVFHAPQYFPLSHHEAPAHGLPHQQELPAASLVRSLNPLGAAHAAEKTKNTWLESARKNRISKLHGGTIDIRMRMYQRALGYWQEQPLIGIGLGGFLWHSNLKGVPQSESTIHSTGVWLLTETGVLGFLLFLAFFSVCFIALLKSKASPLAVGVAGVLLVMLGASAGTEILYQRYLWFLLGMALVVANEPSGAAV